MNAAARLIRDTWEQRSPELTCQHAVVLNAGDGFLGTELRGLLPNTPIDLYERHAVLHRGAKARQGLHVPDHVEPLLAHQTDSSATPSQANIDFIALLMPKGRAWARRQIVQAWHMLAPGGLLWIAGPSRRGVKGLISDAKAIFGTDGEILGYKDHQRVVEFIRQDAPIDESQKTMRQWWGQNGIMPQTYAEFELPMPDSIQPNPLIFKTIAGVFSYEHIDPGTQTLIQQLPSPKQLENKRIADVGCGAGVLGLYAAACGASHVDLFDIDRLAIDCAKHNAELNDLTDRCHIQASDNLPPLSDESLSHHQPDDGYDLIVSNPAFHQGETVDYTMAQTLAERAVTQLKPGGRLFVVANRFLAYHRYLAPVFGPDHVKRVFEDTKFHVFEAKRLG